MKLKMSKLPASGSTRIALFVLIYFCLTVSSLTGEQQQGTTGLSREESLRLGEQIYRKGILPSGKPATAIVQGDIQFEGIMFSCESCHMRSGLGSYEGGVLTTPTNGSVLFSSQFNVRQPSAAQLRTIPEHLRPLYQAPPRRPAYEEKTLAVALRYGIDPTGRVFNAVMPRYLLNDRDMAILVYYLKSLSAEYSPGVTDTTLSFATVVTDDVPTEEREAMLRPLENYIRGRNSKAKTFESRVKYGFYAEGMDLTYRRLTLARWELKGPPETWRKQLEEFYRKEPVFALLGGITNGEWRPVHEFSEEHRIPCILPITDFPVISEADWYTLYFSKGFYQEGETVASFLGAMANMQTDKRVLQIFRDTREGRAFSAGFQETWQQLGHKPSVSRMLQAGETITKEFLEQATKKEIPDVIILWLGPEAVQALEGISTDSGRPEKIFLSATLLKQSVKRLPEHLRDIIYITYPYALPSERSAMLNPRQMKDPQLINDRNIPAKMNSLGFLLTDTLMMMRGDFYRERFLEVIDMLQDRSQPYSAPYERFSFGPRQRYAAKGCYVVQSTHGASPEMVKKSDWVIH